MSSGKISAPPVEQEEKLETGTRAAASALFRNIEQLHADADWGRFLDAGTGVNSALWSTALPTERWVGVTGAKDMALRRLPKIADQYPAAALRLKIEALRACGVALCSEEDGLRHGADDVIACTAGSSHR